LTLDLREVIGVPGFSRRFDYSPDISGILDIQYISTSDTHAVGVVQNFAGALTLTAKITANVKVICSRCLAVFTWPLEENISARLSESEDSVEDSELYYIGDAKIDLDEIITTELLLNISPFPLCKEDCRGLCVSCGKDLNTGVCECKPEIDPRFGALASLLE